jgi:O-antigen/teichoic acid export membrane protein/glycosyltransferase involved in cell wall biosynthesis
VREDSTAFLKEAGTETAASLQDAKARIPRNIVYNFAGYAINILVAFLIAPVVVHRLGETAYGVWGLIGQIIGYSFLFDFGIRIAVTRYVGRHLALHEPRQINRVLTTGLAFSVASAALALAGGGIVAYFLPQLFAIPPHLVADARIAVLLTSVAFATSFPGSLFTGCVAALSRYDLLNIRNVGPNVLRGLLLWFFLYRGYGLVAVAAISAATFVLCYVLDLFFASRHLPDFKIGREFLDAATLRTLLNFSFYAFVLTISWRLLFMTDNIVVGFVLGPAAVTYYSVGMSLVDLLRGSLGSISNIFAPLASQMDALRQKDSLRNILFRGSRICLLYALPGVGALVVVGPSFLGFWMGEAFVNRSGPVVIVLAVEVACFALSSVSGQVLYGMNRHKANAWLSMGQAAANLSLSAILIRWMGPVGVAWGTLMPALIVEGIILPAYTARVLEVSLRRYYLQAALRPVLAAVPYVFWLWFLRAEGLIRGYPSLVLAVCSGLIVYGLLAWQFALNSEDREIGRRWFANFKSAVMGAGPAQLVPPPAAIEAPSLGSPDSARERSAKLHILTVARYPLGGIRTYLKYTYGHFDRGKYRFTIAASQFPEGSLIPRDLSGFEVDLHESDEASGSLGLMRLTHKALRSSRVDLIHSQGWTAGLLAILANWRLRRPHVITPHEVFREDQFAGFWGSLKRRLMTMVLSRADLIVCVTEDARENFHKFLPWFPAEKLTVVPNGIDTQPFAETAERRRQRAAEVRPPDSPFTFAFFGRFMPAKGFDILTDAVAELAQSGGAARPFRVLAVNRGDRIGRYKAEVSRRGLDAFFEFPGFTPSVTDVLAHVDAVVVPSRWETGPLLPMEAMVAGCPLIASDCIGLREVVRGTPALVASAGDPHSLAQQMKTAMDHEAELRAACCDFASVAQDRFDVRHSAATMEQIFSRLATSKSRDVRQMQTQMVVANKQSRRGREAGDGDL